MFKLKPYVYYNYKNWSKSKMTSLREKLKIPESALNSLNDFIMNENNPLINNLLKVIEKYGGVEEINKKAEEANKLDNIKTKLEIKKPEFARNIEWLEDQRDENAFISVSEYKKKILGEKYGTIQLDDEYAIALELSALQYFPL